MLTEMIARLTLSPQHAEFSELQILEDLRRPANRSMYPCRWRVVKANIEFCGLSNSG
jgi:hypothetical protein